VVCLSYFDAASVSQFSQIAAYRAFGDLQRVRDFILWDNDLTVSVGKLIHNEIEQLARDACLDLAAQPEFVQFVHVGLFAPPFFGIYDKAGE
jgi:hypothetical protein